MCVGLRWCRILAASRIFQQSIMLLAPSLTLFIDSEYPEWPEFVLAAIQDPITSRPLRLSISITGGYVGSEAVLEALERLESCPKVHEVRLKV
jgi:hypothetical protein